MTEPGVETLPLDHATPPPSQVSLIIYGRDGSRVVALAEDKPIVIGRDATCDVSIEDPSLSREHAVLRQKGGEVWLEDLGSTNATLVNGERVTEARVDSGDDIRLGGVAVAIHRLGAAQSRALGIDSHDRFVERLEEELQRAEAFHRPAALLMLRGQEPLQLARLSPLLRESLRNVDRIGAYSASIVEVLLPETDAVEAHTIAERLGGAAKAVQWLGVGVACIPDHATDLQAWLAAATHAAQQTTASSPVCCEVTSTRTLQPGSDDEPVLLNAKMFAVFQTILRVASAQIPVLILGETGTGKEVMATALHRASKRQHKPMISVNCGAIPSQLIESQLFGHEKGAFTGADRPHEGVFEAADGGTVFLDEIGELPEAAQAALLRVVETKRVVRVGSTKELTVDVRLVCATHRDLEAKCRQGTFRQDLLFRLNTMTLTVPPLRERPEEVEALAERFLVDANRNNDRRVRSIDAQALRLLQRYDWPGNVRELRNAIERAVVITQGDIVTAADLPDRIQADAAQASPTPLVPEDTAGELRDQLKQYEAKLILDALRGSDWNQTQAAKQLGMPLRTLTYKIKQLGLRKEYNAP